MAKDHLGAHIFDSRIKTEEVTKKERFLGFFIGPVSVMLMNSVLNNYLNVYYTDVINTVATGLAMAALNLGITRLKYVAPIEGAAIPVQNEAVRLFFILCAVGFQTFVYPVVAFVLMRTPDDRKNAVSA